MEETNLFGDVTGEEIAGYVEDDSEEPTAGGFAIIDGGQPRPKIKRKKKER